MFWIKALIDLVRNGKKFLHTNLPRYHLDFESLNWQDPWELKQN